MKIKEIETQGNALLDEAETLRESRSSELGETASIAAINLIADLRRQWRELSELLQTTSRD